ncbi:MAG: hypothetical protein ACUVTP_13445 [Candidatus Fervidibacter sp.]
MPFQVAIALLHSGHKGCILVSTDAFVPSLTERHRLHGMKRWA